jgi:hypothetical protein
MKYIIVLILTFHAFADCTLNNNISAGFDKNVVKVYFTSNSTCTNANVTQTEMLSIISDAVDNYWNKVPTSSIKFVNGGVLSTSNSDYLDGDMCDTDLDTCEATTIPKASDIVIACNDNVTSSNNFKPVGASPSKKIAVALPNNISGGKIKGSVIIINDTTDSPFKDLDYASRVAVIAHEIGHAFGLGHSNSTASLMYWKVQDIRHSLGPDDVACISYLYPVHVDGCGLLTVDSTNKNDPSNKGPFYLSFLLGLLIVLAFKRSSKL